jgi:hypothetical protein
VQLHYKAGALLAKVLASSWGTRMLGGASGCLSARTENNHRRLCEGPN